MDEGYEGRRRRRRASVGSEEGEEEEEEEAVFIRGVTQMRIRPTRTMRHIAPFKTPVR